MFCFMLKKGYQNEKCEFVGMGRLDRWAGCDGEAAYFSSYVAAMANKWGDSLFATEGEVVLPEVGYLEVAAGGVQREN